MPPQHQGWVGYFETHPPPTNHSNSLISFTKWVEAFPMPNMEATTVAQLFVDQFVCRFGTAEFLHTDQGRNFESTIIKKSCKLLGITKTRTSPYHPQSDGLVERFNCTVLNMLSIMTQEDEHCWDLHLPRHDGLPYQCPRNHGIHSIQLDVRPRSSSPNSCCFWFSTKSQLCTVHQRIFKTDETTS